MCRVHEVVGPAGVAALKAGGAGKHPHTSLVRLTCQVLNNSFVRRREVVDGSDDLW